MQVVDHSSFEPKLIESVKQLCRPLRPIPCQIDTKLDHLPGIRAVLFDVYGTLFVSHCGDIGTTSSEACETSFRLALNNCGVRSKDAEVPHFISRFGELNREHRDWLRQQGIDYPEMDVVEIWRQIIDELREDGRIDIPMWAEQNREGFIRRLAVEYEYRLNPAWPMPGLEATLDDLNWGGVRYGLISNAQFYSPLLFSALAGKSTRQLGFDSDLLVWSYEHRAVKPSPILFKQALHRLNAIHSISPEQVLFVGNDKLKDTWAAAQSGMRTALFAGDRRSLRMHESDARCSQFEPDLIITELTQIGEALGVNDFRF